MTQRFIRSLLGESMLACPVLFVVFKGVCEWSLNISNHKDLLNLNC